MTEGKDHHPPVIEEATPLSTQSDLITDIPDPTIPTWRLTLLIVSLSTGLFLSLLDTSIIATSLYSISLTFHTTQTTTWVALSYTLSYLSFSVPFANLSDVIGRRSAWLLAFTIFFVFSIACGFARSLGMLVAFRAFQGVGGSGLYSLTMVILPEVVSKERKKFIGGLAGLVVAVAGVLGPVVGGVITRFATWRWVFWINGPIGVVPVTLFLFTWPTKDMMHHAERRSWKRLDFLGCFLLIAASVLVVFSFQEGGLRTDAWPTALFLAPLLVGCLCWILLFVWEIHVSGSSISAVLPPRLLKLRVYSSAVLVTMVSGFVNLIAIYSLPLHFQIVNGTGTLMAGVALLPLLVSAAIGSMLGGLTTNHTFPALAIASSLMALGTGLLSTLSNHTGVQPKTYGFEVLLGLGVGLSISSSTLVAATETEPADRAIAQGIVAQARVLGGSIGIAASTAILGMMVEHATHETHSNPAAAERIAYAKAFSKTMWVSAVLACLGLLFSVGTYRKDTSSKSLQEAPNVMRKVEEETISRDKGTV